MNINTVLLAVITAVPAYAGGRDELDRGECLALLNDAAEARTQIEVLVEDLDNSIFMAMISDPSDKVPTSDIPTEGLLDQTRSTWDEIEAGLGDLCRDKL